MSRPPPPYYGRRGVSGGGFRHPTYPHQNPTFVFSGNLQSHVNLPNNFQNPFQNPTMPQPAHHYFQNTVFPQQNTSPNLHATIQRVDAAATKAHRDLVDAGQSVSAWKVSQAALVALKVEAWSSLGFQIQDVPSLHSLIVTEGKINAFIHCFVGSRRITSLYDLEVAVCNNEGVQRFEELNLGPLLRHPLIEHYFSVPSDLTHIFRITTEEIVGLLHTLMEKEKHKKMIKVEELLDFLAHQKSVPSKEKLGVRIQSLGLHVSYIRKAMKEEKATINKYLDKQQNWKEDSSQPPNMIVQKQALERRFGWLSKRVETFASECDDFAGKHIHFESSDSDEVSDDDKDNVQNQNFHNNDSGKRVSTCPYPSTTEEMMRLGLKLESTEKTTDSGKLRKHGSKMGHGKKRKLEVDKGSSPCKLLKMDDMALKRKEVLNDFTPTNVDIDKFITTWKEACREHSFIEVFHMMVNFYATNVKQRRRTRRSLLSYPGLGLMGVAITSIKHGLVDSLYDTFQAFGESEFSNPKSASEMIDIEPANKENAISNAAKSTDELKRSIAVDAIIKKVAEYSQLENFIDKVLPSEKILWSLKKLHSCEMWLVTHFSVKEFSSLGHGNFLEFLERHASLLPRELNQILNGVTSDPSPMHISLCGKQLSVFLSLADYNWAEEGFKTKNDALMLLKKQFPTISFNIVGDEFDKCFLNDIKCQKDNYGTDCVLFSAPLLGKQWSRFETYEKYSSGAAVSVDQQICTFETSAFKNAMDCLLAAPMLSDLLSWSHWDLIYAPSFGPLIDWLLNEVHTKELLCIVTRDGKLIKVDSSATVDEFLEALVQLSSFQVSLKLLSLLSLYRGTSHAPLSLLKCYAQRAMDVIVRNFIDSSEKKINPTMGSLQEMPGSDDYFKIGPCSGELQGISQFGLESMLGKTMAEVNKAFAIIAKLILECLGLLPSEFWSFAADILVSGLQSFTREAHSIILNVCNLPHQRLMLHDIGLSLGVAEWVQDYHDFSSRTMMDPRIPQPTSYSVCSKSGTDDKHIPELSPRLSINNDDFHVSLSEPDMNRRNESFSRGKKEYDNVHEGCHEALRDGLNMGTLNENLGILDCKKIQDATLVIEAIRREEFGLDSNLTDSESCLLKKQHARLGRALHCLSQELYSQDSHLLLELVQNADDNAYSHGVEPTLLFILQDSGIVVLNNEVGFSADNIRALCDIGNSTKKGSSAGYIGHKGIGFKSVFRVTDAPEIHSNGFHVKFDITEGQIGFILPTIVSPCDINMFREDLQTDLTSWNTCIILPFRSKLAKETTMSSIISMFSDLHPSLLLFLHRLRCIRFMNVLNNTSLLLRREIMGNGIVKVSHGSETLSWLVVSKKLEANVTRPGVQNTEIAVAFTLQESEFGEYRPILSQQPAFAFLPLRNYGLKFILQGDFILPSSREEVDGDSAWNQWLLSEFPALFVNAEQSFCSLPCFQENPGKAVAAYMSFVPLVGEVHGFFSHLPHMIISKLRMSNCLLLDGPSLDWVLPCRTLRGWDEQARFILPDRLLQKHLGLGYLNKDVILSDMLAKALGVQDYGPKVLVDFISFLCRSSDGIESLGLDWLSSWFLVLYSTLSSSSSRHSSLNCRMESDLINTLRKIPLIPLSDGSYGSISDGPIWLPCEICSVGFEGKQYQNYFPRLYDKLRTVNSLLFSAPTMTGNHMEVKKVENLIQMLSRIGVQQLSAHEVIKSHILAAFSDEKETKKVEGRSWMIEYLSFIMVHLQSPCANCLSEKGDIISELRKRSILLTNDGYRCPANEPIHFSKEYGNSVDIDKLIGKLGLQWLEVDVGYLKHPSTNMISSAAKVWREFLEELGVTDFVQVNCVKKHASDVLLSGDTVSTEELIIESSFINDWESAELDQMISTFSLKKYRDKCIYLLEVLDTMWDNCYNVKAKAFWFNEASGYKKPIEIESSFMKNMRTIEWIASSMDLELHKSRDLFYSSEEVQSVLGNMAPYVVPQLTSKLLLKEFGFKMQLSHDDVFTILHYWRTSKTPFVASAIQMSRFYSFISEGVSASRVNITKEFISSSFIFVPFANTSTSKPSDTTAGTFLSPKDLCWNDPTGCIDKTKEVLQRTQRKHLDSLPCQALSIVYPGLHEFFVQVCHVHEVPTFGSYLQILLQLSSVALPSQAAPAVFRVFLRWSDDIKSGLVKSDEIFALKNDLHKLEITVLPTMLDKWVSLHPSFGLLCWVDDEDLKEQFKHSNGIDFLQFGDLNSEEKEMLSGKVAMLMQKLGVPALSQVVHRDAIFYGTGDNRGKMSLINWALPYAQRYIYKLHEEKYLELKLYGLEKLSQLKILVVEKLFYRHSLKGCNSTSKRRFECSCLLQDTILYATHTSDSHSIFLEFSRFFFGGSAELHFANFLHMITTMAESGSSIEQIEFFIVNSQKIPRLPDEEPVWSLSTLTEELTFENAPSTVAPCSNVEQNASISRRKPGICPSWPPTDWKTALDFSCGRKYSFPSRPGLESYSGPGTESTNSPGIIKQVEVLPEPIEIDDDWIVEEDLASKGTSVFQDSEMITAEPQLVDSSDALDNQVISGSSNENELADSSVSPCPNLSLKILSTSVVRENVSLHTVDDPQSRRAGRLGEIIAYNYLTRRLGPDMVKWVNEQIETGSPYDLIIGDTEYIEVKTTRFASKNWFEISTREWQFAAEHGDSFSIAHVVLSGHKKASITILKNPLKLCKQNVLRLALFMSRQIRDSSVTS
ncbi:hypothetical protein Cni_G18268 [Canna indica]|uniref:Protein NO VEIN C-terminal domain-containing protein n=1 Tax=Canna indica TaxID=4628 RepID=A0AAQ3KKH3_9LILI|nr:hypothetical protein Cni_G18268 [Canna indica]